MSTTGVENSIYESMYISTQTSSSIPNGYWTLSREPTVRIKKAKKKSVVEDIVINDEPALFDPEELV